jgi:pyruvate/2-oxoglutarate dehydrogenase complex dihydrolipoamide acyltransferase (E2) component
MSIPVVLPKLGFAMLEGTIAEWLVADGAIVSEGDIIYAMESEKSVQEVESPASGAIRILGVEGETYPVGTVVAEIS